MHLKSKKSGLIKNKTRIKVNENPFKQLFQNNNMNNINNINNIKNIYIFFN